MDLAYERLGSGPPLVLLHGLGHHGRGFAPVLPLLADSRDVIVPDLPGFGGSPVMPPGEPYSVAGFAGALESFFDRLGVAPPHVAGNSLGGLIALELARRGSARSATALSPVGFGTRAELAYARGVLRLARALAQSLTPQATRRLAGSPVTRAMTMAVFVARPARLAPDDAYAAARALADAAGFAATLHDSLGETIWGQPRVPVTVAWGSRDALLPPWQARRARRMIPRAHFVSLPGCGHLPMSDDPPAVARVLLEGSARG